MRRWIGRIRCGVHACRIAKGGFHYHSSRLSNHIGARREEHGAVKESMPLSYAELEQFYEGLVVRARRRGIPCAITSVMACVAFGVAQATKDCDLHDYGIERMIAEARAALGQIVHPSALAWLPDVREHFIVATV